MVEIVGKWRSSQACPADLCPRAAFKCGHDEWLDAAFLVQQLCGPHVLAYRPLLWRLSTLLAVFKSGNPKHHSSYRLIFIKAQFGLLQEGLMALRVKPVIFDFLQKCQSGFTRGIQDPHMVLHELCCLAKQFQRAIWCVMGDFRKAFPRVWRELLLKLLHKDVGLGHGIFELLANMLESDSVRIWLSGCSETVIRQGIPEGGVLGPLCYNVLPDSLIRHLSDLNLGFGVVESMPAAWASFKWTGHGSPSDELVNMLRQQIRFGGSLPSVEILAQQPVLEASAAQALDLEAPSRVPCLFHADDPLFAASSYGSLPRILHEVAQWTADCGAAFHVASNKTVYFWFRCRCECQCQFILFWRAP